MTATSANQSATSAPKRPNRVSLLFGEHSRELIGPETGLMLLPLSAKKEVSKGLNTSQEVSTFQISYHLISLMSLISQFSPLFSLPDFLLHLARLLRRSQEDALRRGKDQGRAAGGSAERQRVSADSQRQSIFTTSCRSRSEITRVITPKWIRLWYKLT